MPNITLDGSVFNVKPLDTGNQHWNSIAKTMAGQLHLREQDVRIHCKGNQILRASKFSLMAASGVIRSVIGCNDQCSVWTFVPLEFDLVCQDFDADAMEKVIELVTVGSASLDIDDQDFVSEMRLILKNLKMDSLLQFIDTIVSIQNFSFGDSSDDQFESICQRDEETNLNSDQDASDSGLSRAGSSSDERELAANMSLDEPSLPKIVQVLSQQSFNNNYRSYPFQCHQCQRGFRVVEAYNNHELKHHKQMGQDSESDSHSSFGEASPHKRYKKELRERLGLDEGDPSETNVQIVNSKKMNNNGQDAGARTKKATTEEQHPEGSRGSSTSTSTGTSSISRYEPTSSADRLDKKVTTKRVRSEDNPRSDQQPASAKRQPHGLEESTELGSSPSKWECQICSTLLSDKLKYIRHLACKHYRAEIYNYNRGTKDKCEFCGKAAKKSQDLLAHLAYRHNALDNFMSSDVAESITGSHQKSLKIEEVASEPNHTSKIANLDQVTNAKTKIDQVVNDQNSGSEKVVVKTESELISCSICKDEFSNSKILMRHQATKHYPEKLNKFRGKAENECGVCNKICENDRRLVGHLLFKHQVLKKFFRSKEARPVDKIKKRGKRSKPSKPGTNCMICKKSFANRINLVRHIGITHYPKKLAAYLGDSLNCSACGKTARKLQDLKTHVVFVHNPIKDVLDEMLDAGGSSFLKQLPEGEVERATGEKSQVVRKEKQSPARIECSLCDRSFRAKTPHSIHVVLKHLRDKINDTYIAKDEPKCLMCDKVFNRDIEVLIHLATKHDVVVKVLEEGQHGTVDVVKKQTLEDKVKKTEESTA